MIRRFNYTDRQRIPRENIRLGWIENGSGPLNFTIDLDLNLENNRHLNPAGLVFLEAYIGPVVMRFPCGTVEHREYPADTTLANFPPGLKPLFRVKVVDPSADRRLLAWADAVTPLAADEDKSGKRSILPVETVDLGHQVWNLRVESNTFFLQLNAAIREPRDITTLAKEPDFIALVYPAVIRQIIFHLLLGPERASVEDDHPWLIFATQLAGEAAPEDGGDGNDDTAFTDDVKEWSDKVIDGFCQKQHAVEHFVQFKKETEERHV